MSQKINQKELLKIIMSFMDEFVTRYTVLEELKVNLGEHPTSSGYSDTPKKTRTTYSFKFDSIQPQRKELENEVKVFLEFSEFNTTDYDERQLLKVMMKFMDEFMDSRTVLENILSRRVDNMPRHNYRQKSERHRNTVSYLFSGIQPSRQEVERQVRSFIQMKNLS